jgi:hypothetical protein
MLCNNFSFEEIKTEENKTQYENISNFPLHRVLKRWINGNEIKIIVTSRWLYFIIKGQQR